MANRKDLFYVKDFHKEGGKPYWMKVGVAFPNKDGSSYTIILEVMPPQVEGEWKIQMRDHVERESKGQAFED